MMATVMAYCEVFSCFSADAAKFADMALIVRIYIFSLPGPTWINRYITSLN